MKTTLKENFDQPQFAPDLYWFNEPKNWAIQAGKLVIYPEKSDFWSKTHYGFSFDNGHCLLYKMQGDFFVATKVHFLPQHQYDQAGLMVRISKECWLKTSVEYENEDFSRLGVVVTNSGYSDWSTQDFGSTVHEIELKIEMRGQDALVAFKTEQVNWSQMRIAHLHQHADFIQCGLYACCPVDTGFRAEFGTLEIGVLESTKGTND
jgi:regulation of enolase protein 1 (concanavalin A-like superfamily)